LVAYHDQRVFGALPFHGGTLEQPAWLMDGMRLIATRVAEQEAREAAKAERRRNK
jgi:hypothetical protein